MRLGYVEGRPSTADRCCRCALRGPQDCLCQCGSVGVCKVIGRKRSKRREEGWFLECALTSSEALEEALVSGKAGEQVCSVFGELPTLSFEFKVVGNERPVKGWRPVGNAAALSFG